MINGAPPGKGCLENFLKIVVVGVLATAILWSLALEILAL